MHISIGSLNIIVVTFKVQLKIGFRGLMDPRLQTTVYFSLLSFSILAVCLLGILVESDTTINYVVHFLWFTIDIMKKIMYVTNKLCIRL